MFFNNKLKKRVFIYPNINGISFVTVLVICFDALEILCAEHHASFDTKKHKIETEGERQKEKDRGKDGTKCAEHCDLGINVK